MTAWIHCSSGLASLNASRTLWGRVTPSQEGSVRVKRSKNGVRGLWVLQSIWGWRNNVPALELTITANAKLRQATPTTQLLETKETLNAGSWEVFQFKFLCRRTNSILGKLGKCERQRNLGIVFLDRFCDKHWIKITSKYKGCVITAAVVFVNSHACM